MNVPLGTYKNQQCKKDNKPDELSSSNILSNLFYGTNNPCRKNVALCSIANVYIDTTNEISDKRSRNCIGEIFYKQGVNIDEI